MEHDSPPPTGLSSKDSPDRYTNAWWDQGLQKMIQQIRGISHSVNRCNAEYAACWEAVLELRATCETLKEQTGLRDAELGRLGERLEQVEESLQKAREAYAELRKKNGG